MIETAMQEFGRLDALINNAGITRDTLIMRMTEEDWDAVFDHESQRRISLFQSRNSANVETDDPAVS